MKNQNQQPVDPKVVEAVNDILNGKTKNTTEEWLQREYVRLMKREVQTRKELNALHQQLKEHENTQ